MPQPSPQPLYTAADLHPAYELRYGWTGWPSDTPFPVDVITQVLPGIAPEWEGDGLRLLESSLTPEQLQLTLSARPEVSPVTLAARVKGRLQYHCRTVGRAVAFSRKVAVRSLGHNHRQNVEDYIRGQVAKEELADERFRDLLERLCVLAPEVDLSRPTETHSGRYWYNLHLVLVVAERIASATRIHSSKSAICVFGSAPRRATRCPRWRYWPITCTWHCAGRSSTRPRRWR